MRKNSSLMSSFNTNFWLEPHPDTPAGPSNTVTQPIHQTQSHKHSHTNTGHIATVVLPHIPYSHADEQLTGNMS